MKNREMARLNFTEIIKYKDVDGYSKERPYKCDGFCIDCENRKLLENNEYLEAISHAADSDDFSKLYSVEYKNNKKVMMVFENPGGNANDYLGEWIEYKGIKKYVPTNIYYWLDDKLQSPPTSVEELIEIGIFYGPYLAYIINKYN